MTNGFCDVQYQSMVKQFIIDTGMIPVNNKWKRSSIIWDHESELYSLWLCDTTIGYVSFRRIAVLGGYPDKYYKSMVDCFRTKYYNNCIGI